MCSARVIFESDLMQDFLELKHSSGSSSSGGGATLNATGSRSTPPQRQKTDHRTDLRVLLTDNSVVSVPISEHWRSTEVFEVHVCTVCM